MTDRKNDPSQAHIQAGDAQLGNIPLPNVEEFSANMVKIAEKSQQLVAEFLKHQDGEAGARMDSLGLGSAFFEMTSKLIAHPAKLIEAQMTLWQDYVRLWQNAALKLWGEPTQPLIEPAKSDRRFRGPDWEENQVFDFIKQSYLLTARWLQNTVREVEGLEPAVAQKVDFYSRQFIDALAPSNFILTNPDVLRATIESNGQNLVNGLEHMLEDLDRGKGRLAIKMTDMDAFKLGVNVAATPGKVVHRDKLFELLQYSPTTETVYKRPILFFPPWINKFYILDLRPENSMVKWLVEQGYTVFLVSWVNPDETLAEIDFADYVKDGAIAAVDAVQRLTGEDEISAVGFCLGGTLLSTTLAYMAATGDKRIRAATFFASQTDFTEAGELLVFIDEEQLKALDESISKKGYMDGADMATTFNLLRANDLIWSFVVNNYLLGKEPFPFDLLYWNSDSTRMPRAMHMFYLREMYLNNNLCRQGGIMIDDVPIDLSKIRIPTYIQASKEDHIAPFSSVYKSAKLFRGQRRFVLAGSGHVAGVINHPDAKKYSYSTNESLPDTPAEFLQGATTHPGSWWPDWEQWLRAKAGKQVPARVPAVDLGDAPGTYVFVKS